MARIQTGALISDIRGSIGGTTFQRNASGLVAHNKMSLPNFSTNAQTARRNLLASLQQSWMSLTAARRLAWQTWATYQNIKVRTFSTTGAYGQQAFLQANFYASLLGLPVLLDPVFSPYSMSIQSWALKKYMTDINIEVVSTSSHTLFWPCFKVSAIQMASVNTARSQLTWMAPAAYGSYGWNIAASFLAAYGQTLDTGNKVFVEAGFLQIDNYTLSSFQKVLTTIGNHG